MDRSVRTVDPCLHIGRYADMKLYGTLANSNMYFCFGLNKIINNFESYCNCFTVKLLRFNFRGLTLSKCSKADFSGDNAQYFLS